MQGVDSKSGELAVRREYARLAPVYDERWSFYIRATLEETAKRLALRANDKVLDVGCGTGALFQAIAPRRPSAEFVGADLSAEMLALARRKTGGRAAFLGAGANRLPFRARSFDTVVSCNAFHY
ncbi:MAG: class I SAM-dependent methyltransferase, partial [bacterium]